MIKNVVFDIGGVLISNTPDSRLEALPYSEKTIAAMHKSIYTFSIWDKMDVGIYQDMNEALDEFVALNPKIEKELRSFFEPGWMKEIYLEKPEMQPLYNLCCQRLNVYLLSNYAKDGFEFLKNTYSFVNKARGAVVSAYEGIRKPDLMIYKRLLERFKLKAEETVFIDDNAENIKVASSLGIVCIRHESAAKTEAALRSIIARELA